MRIRLSRCTVVLALLLAPLERGDAQSPTQTVRGVVRDTSGAPLDGAQVLIGSHRTRTSEEGTFHVDGLAPGRYAVTIRMIGFAPVRSRVGVVAGEPTEVEYLLVPAPHLLRTTVVEAQRIGIFGVVGDTAYRQLVGARVQLFGPRTFDVRSDSLGHFAFADIPPGEYFVRVTRRGFAERWLTVPLPKGEGRDLAFLLPPSTREVTVMDNVASLDLGRRMTMGLKHERILGDALERMARGGCNVAPITARLGVDPNTTIILNGRFVLGGMRVPDICTFGLDDLDMIEFGPDVCAEVTHTIADLMQVTCTGFHTRIRPSIDARGTRGTPRPRSYVVLWEKR